MEYGYRGLMGNPVATSTAAADSYSTAAHDYYAAQGSDSNSDRLPALYARKSSIERELASLRSKLAEAKANRAAYEKNIDDPIYKSAAQRYIDTGDNSALQAWKNAKNAEEQQRVVREQMKAEKEKAERVGVQSALNSIESANATMNNPDASRADKIMAQNKYAEARNLLINQYGYANVPALSAGSEQTEATYRSTNQLVRDAENIMKRRKSARPLEDVIADIDNALVADPNNDVLLAAKYELEDWTNEEKWQTNYRILQNEKPETFNTKKERTDWNKKVDAALKAGDIDRERANSLYSDVETTSGAVKKARQGAVAGAAGKKTTESIEEENKKKELAKAGRARIEKGLRPTREQQDAINEGK